MQFEKRDSNDTADDGSIEALKRYVAEQLREGQDRFTLIKELTTGKGMRYSDASRLVHSVHLKFLEYEEVRRQSKTQAAVGEVLLKSLGIAILSGAFWGGVAITIDFARGWGALLVGVICGYIVMKVTKGESGKIFQVLATLAAFVGVIVGKYILFNFVTVHELAQQGVDIPKEISLFSVGMVKFFVSHFGYVFGLSGFFFLFLALVVAWTVPLFLRGSQPPSDFQN